MLLKTKAINVEETDQLFGEAGKIVKSGGYRNFNYEKQNFKFHGVCLN